MSDKELLLIIVEKLDLIIIKIDASMSIQQKRLELILRPDYLDVAHIAKRCNVNHKLVETWIRDGILPTITLGKSRRINAFELEELIRSNKLNYLHLSSCPPV